MPKVILAHPTQSPLEQLHRYYAGLVKRTSESEADLSVDETMALALFSDCAMRVVENPLVPDEPYFQNVHPIIVCRPAPGAPLEVHERHVVDWEAVKECLSVKLVNGSIN